jgi:hypothetical protein
MRGRVVTFRPAVRILMRPRHLPSGRLPAVVLRLDERRRRDDPATGKWFVTSSGGALRLFFLKLCRPWSTSPTKTVDVTHGPLAFRDNLSPSAGADARS